MKKKLIWLTGLLTIRLLLDGRDAQDRMIHRLATYPPFNRLTWAAWPLPWLSWRGKLFSFPFASNFCENSWNS